MQTETSSYSILDFIDSPDIRAYNRTTAFTPLEQALLIDLSTKATIEEKMAGWETLLTRYSEQEFGMIGGGRATALDNGKRVPCTFCRQIVQDVLDACRHILARREENAGFVFVSSFRENGEAADRQFWLTYRAALAGIQARKKEYTDNGWDEDVDAIISREKLDGDTDSYGDSYRFDSDMRLVALSAGSAYESDCKKLDGLKQFFFTVPVPFRRGDLLKFHVPGGDVFGILSSDQRADAKRFQKIMKETGLPIAPDASDMVLNIDCYQQRDGKMHFGWEHADVLALQKADDDELPENTRNLLVYRDVILGKSSLIGFLTLYDEYGWQTWKQYGYGIPNP